MMQGLIATIFIILMLVRGKKLKIYAALGLSLNGNIGRFNHLPYSKILIFIL